MKFQNSSLNFFGTDRCMHGHISPNQYAPPLFQKGCKVCDKHSDKLKTSSHKQVDQRATIAHLKKSSKTIKVGNSRVNRRI